MMQILCKYFVLQPKNDHSCFFCFVLFVSLITPVCREPKFSQYLGPTGIKWYACILYTQTWFQGTQIGPLLVFSCLALSRENAIVLCKIVAFLCSLVDFPLKNVIVFFFGNYISKWHSFERKKVIFNLLFAFQSTGERHKFLHRISYLHSYTYFTCTQLVIFAFLILTKLQIHCVWFLFGVTPSVDSYRPFQITIGKFRVSPQIPSSAVSVTNVLNKETIFLIWHIGSQLRIVLETRGIAILRFISGESDLKMSITAILEQSINNKVVSKS